MKLFREFLWIISFTYLGELISHGFHLPIPGSVIGMVLLFLALYFNLLKVKHVDTVGQFLLDNLSIFFLPAGVGIMVYFPVIKDTWWLLLLITLIVTAFTIGVVGFTVQQVKRRFEGDLSDLSMKKETKMIREEKTRVVSVD